MGYRGEKEGEADWSVLLPLFLDLPPRKSVLKFALKLNNCSFFWVFFVIFRYYIVADFFWPRV